MTQTQDIALYLRDVATEQNPLTPSLARRLFSCDRLAARIWEIKNEGVLIPGTREKQTYNVLDRTVQVCDVKGYWYVRPGQGRLI